MSDLSFLQGLKKDSKRDSAIVSDSPLKLTHESISTKVPFKDVIIRTMMQKTVFKIYPNGDVFLDKGQCLTWFTDQKQIYKKKEKKKAKPSVETKIEGVEEY